MAFKWSSSDLHCECVERSILNPTQNYLGDYFLFRTFMRSDVRLGSEDLRKVFYDRRASTEALHLYDLGRASEKQRLGLTRMILKKMLIVSAKPACHPVQSIQEVLIRPTPDTHSTRVLHMLAPTHDTAMAPSTAKDSSVTQVRYLSERSSQLLHRFPFF